MFGIDDTPECGIGCFGCEYCRSITPATRPRRPSRDAEERDARAQRYAANKIEHDVRLPPDWTWDKHATALAIHTPTGTHVQAVLDHKGCPLLSAIRRDRCILPPLSVVRAVLTRLEKTEAGERLLRAATQHLISG